MFAIQTKMEKERNTLMNQKENLERVMSLKDKTIEELKS